MVISPLAVRRFAVAMIALGLLSLMFLAWTTLSHQESTLAIRPVSQGVSVPDGFSVWHHLDATASALRASPRRTMFY